MSRLNRPKENLPERVITKYPNRRLYDTEISRYITLEEIRQLVLSDIKFKVVDKHTQEDITRSILLQVISEQEQNGQPIFTAELLTHIVRYYGDSMQGTLGRYLEFSLQLFMQQQNQLKDKVHVLINQFEHSHTITQLKDFRATSREQLSQLRELRREFVKNLRLPGPLVEKLLDTKDKEK